MSMFNRWFKKKETTTPIVSAEMEQRHILGLRKDRKIPTLTQLRYIPDYFTTNERFIIKSLLLLVVATALVIGIRLWQKHIVWVPKNGGTYTEGLVGAPRFINPVLAIGTTSDMDLTELLFPGLVKTDNQNKLVPDLAETFTISDDNKTYTFTLRKGLKWDDNEALNADDVMFTYQLVQDPSYSSPWKSTFSSVTFAKVDDYTITATLKNPSALFLAYFTLGILPSHRFQDIQPQNFLLLEDNTRPTGSGPFKFKSLVRTRSGDLKSMIFERNPLYYGKQPYLDEIHFKFYPDITTAQEGVRNREVQGLAFVPPWQEKTGEHIGNVKRQDLILPQVTALIFNLKNDIFKKKDVRRALVLGTNRTDITKTITHGEALISEGPFAPGFIGSVADLAPRPYIPDEANALLESSGFKKGADGMRKNGNNNLRIVVTTPEEEPYMSIATILKDNWGKLGIEVEIQAVDPVRFSQDVLKPRRYDALLYGELFDQTLDPYPFWDSSEALDPGLNLSIYVNKTVDTLLEKARVEKDEKKRDADYQEVQRTIADDIPAMFLFTPKYQYYLPKNLHGVIEGDLITPAERFSDVTNWYEKMTPVIKSHLKK